MSSFKQLSRSDVTVVANNANKQWNLDFYCFPASSQYLTIYKGTNLTSSFSPTNDPKSQGQYERLIYTEINQLFYQSYTASLNTSSLARSIYYESASEQRPTASYFIFNDNSNLTASFPSGANETIRVISINQNVYGNKVLPGSFILTSSAYNVKDDSYGNLRDGSTHIGNIFYAQGLAVITNQDYQLMFPVDSSSCATTTTTTTTTTTSTTTTTTTVAPTTTTTTTTSTTTTTTTVEPTTSTTTTTTTVEPTTSTTTTTTTEPTTSTTTTTTTVAPTTTSTTTTTTTEPITTTSTTTTTTTAEPTTTTSTTTTTTTAEPTTTTSTTTTTTTCTCYEYDVDIIQSDLDNATGNTDPFRNGRVFVSYRNCDDSGFTTLTYTTASYYGNAFCMNSNPIYSPVFDVWQNDVQLTVTSSTAINTGNCCSFTPTTTTTTSTTTTTTTAEPTTTSTTTTTTTAEPTTSTTTTTTTAEPTTSTTTTTTTSNIADITVSNSSLDIAITSVTVNGVAVTHTSGTNFTINAGDPTGYFTTNELGTYDIVVYYNSSISGQNIIIIDCASNSQCCTTTGSGGSCTLVGASISGGCTINIAATDGACV